MKYTILIYENQPEFNARIDQRAPEYWGSWSAYTEALVKAGVMAGGSGLQPPETATTIRIVGGERQVHDGPFADTKEQLGGFYIIDVPDLDTALTWAARCPGLPNGVIELRPVLEMN